MRVDLPLAHDVENCINIPANKIVDMLPPSILPKDKKLFA